MNKLEELQMYYKILDFVYSKWDNEDSVEKNLKDILEDLEKDIDKIKFGGYN